MFRKVRRYAQDPYYALGYDMIKKCPHLMSDKFYLSVLWKMKMGYELDWKHPIKFNEKLQWLKLHDRNPEYTTMVDKYRAKQWIADKIGEQYVIPTLAVYKSVDEIDLDQLPDRFVLKCNHDSGSVVICRDKSTFDLDAAKRKLSDALKKNFYWEAREWPYRNVKRCVFAEEFLEEHDSKTVPTDYKFFCYDGEPRFLQTCVDRNGLEGAILTFYDTDGTLLDLKDKYHSRVAQTEALLPGQLQDMLRISRIMAKGLAFLRVDFYEIGKKVYCGELTFYENGGFCEFSPEKYNRILGDWIKLPTDNNQV